jgi:hypothetical protein
MLRAQLGPANGGSGQAASDAEIEKMKVRDTPPRRLRNRSAWVFGEGSDTTRDLVLGNVASLAPPFSFNPLQLASSELDFTFDLGCCLNVCTCLNTG